MNMHNSNGNIPREDATWQDQCLRRVKGKGQLVRTTWAWQSRKGARGAEYVAYVLVYLGSIRWNYVAIWRAEGACVRGHLAYEVLCFVSLLFTLSVHPCWEGLEKCFHRGSNPLSAVSDRIIHWCKDNIKTKLGQTLWICEMHHLDRVTVQSTAGYSEHNDEIRTS